jgi:hypothetical protein
MSGSEQQCHFCLMCQRNRIVKPPQEARKMIVCKKAGFINKGSSELPSMGWECYRLFPFNTIVFSCSTSGVLSNPGQITCYPNPK